MPEAPVQSVKKAMDLLSVLAFEDPARTGVGVRDLASRMGIPANSTHNLQKTLHHYGAVSQTADRKYVVGPVFGKISRVGLLVAEETREDVAPVMLALSARLQETVALTTLVIASVNRLYGDGARSLARPR